MDQTKFDSSVLAPARQLPVELLTEIFMLAVPFVWNRESIGTKTLNFAQVCHTWRAVALGIPSLWTNIRVDDRCPRHGWKDAALAYLQRSAPLPMSIHMNLLTRVGFYMDYEDVMLHDDFWSDDVWQAMCTQASRWERVALEHLPDGTLRAQNPPLLFPALSQLSLSTRDLDKVPVDFFQNSPNMRCLSLSTYHTIAPLVLPSSWRLTTLTLKCGEGEMGQTRASLAPCVQAILACSPTLEYLHVTALGFRLSRLPQNATVFPALEDLILVGACHLCALISAPNLVEACLDASSMPSPVTASDLMMFEYMVTKSSGCPKLESLSLRNVQQTPDLVIRCLRRIPSLTHLSVIDNDGYEIPNFNTIASMELVRALTRKPSSRKFLPNLTSLLLYFNEDDDDEDDYYMENRWDEEDSELKIALDKMTMSRSEPQTTKKGLVLKRLEAFKTDCRGYY